MDIKKVLLAKSLTELLLQLFSFRMSIKLSHMKLLHALSTHKIRSFFYAENTLHKVLCKLTYPVALEDKKKSFMKLILVTKK